MSIACGSGSGLAVVARSQRRARDEINTKTRRHEGTNVKKLVGMFSLTGWRAPVSDRRRGQSNVKTQVTVRKQPDLRFHIRLPLTARSATRQADSCNWPSEVSPRILSGPCVEALSTVNIVR